MELLLLYGGATLLAGIAIGRWILRRGRDEATRSGPPVTPALIRISQPAAGYPLVWEIDGRRYRSIDAIEENAHRALAIAAVRQLMHQLPPEAVTSLFLEEDAAPVTPVEPETIPQAVHLSSPSPPRTPAPAESPTQSVRPSPPNPPTTPLPARPTSLDDDLYSQPFWKRFKESLFDAPPPTPAPGSSLSGSSSGMLEQIDELFQEYLRRLPGAPEAFVRPAPGGGMQIIVAGRAYESAEAIPYPEIAAALRQAIKSWEANN